MKRIVLVAGARPNFMKIAPIIDAIHKARENGAALVYALVHTGQHYDARMSEEFFIQLGIPEPDVNLEAGGGSQAEQAAAIMVRFERYLIEHPADLVLVVGDVTSTLACTIVAKKLNTKVAHVEGGIRSGDMTMPEEINRIVTDSIADYFFTTSRTANENLIHEGKEKQQIHFVGNTMIDSLLTHMPRLHKPECWNTLGLNPGQYFVMTLHRPSNVDSRDQLFAIFQEIERNSGEYPIIFPVHPRTRKNMEQFGLALNRVHLSEPLGYLEFNYLVKHACGVITDSGGITEETTVMGVPCVTLRNSTERPETITEGTNVLIGTDPSSLGPEIAKMVKRDWKKGSIPELWDGRAAERIVDVILNKL